MKYKIFPAIGFARLGDSPEFIIAREKLGSRETEVVPGGAETEVTDYKDGNLKIKKVAARFRLFVFPDDNSAPTLLDTSDGTTVDWTVHPQNRKNAVQRGGIPPITGNASALPQPIGNPAPVTIDPGARSISGKNASGQKFDTGKFQGTAVPLGELRTDAEGNLLVIGAEGFSSSPNSTNLNSFYDNPGWHDDTCDGPVTAKVTLADGTVINDVEPAWVVVGPPDFAPDIEGLVTLYDILLQVGSEHFGVPLGNLSFSRDIFPILSRTSRLQWVNGAPEWENTSTDWAHLADSSAGAQSDRQVAANAVISGAAVISRFRLTETQEDILEEYVAGNFSSDWSGIPSASNITPDGLTRAALDSTVGQGFFPGIEAGIVTQNKDIYASPFDFRPDHSQIKPGDLTALMAVPWQADFLACNQDWWPSQRPNDIRTDPNSTVRSDWDRGINTFLEMVQKFAKPGFVVAKTDAAGNIVYAEVQRDPAL